MNLIKAPQQLVFVRASDCSKSSSFVMQTDILVNFNPPSGAAFNCTIWVLKICMYSRSSFNAVCWGPQNSSKYTSIIRKKLIILDWWGINCISVVMDRCVGVVSFIRPIARWNWFLLGNKLAHELLKPWQKEKQKRRMTKNV